MASPQAEMIPFQEADDFDDDDFYDTPVKNVSAPQETPSNTIESSAPAPATLSPTIPGLKVEPISSLEAPLASGNALIEIDIGPTQTLLDLAVSEEKASLDNHEEKAPVDKHEEKALLDNHEEKSPVDNHDEKFFPDAMDIEQKEISLNLGAAQQDLGAAATYAPITKSHLDAEFLQAAEENKNDLNAEWQFDEEDAEAMARALESSDSDSDSSDDNSDDSSNDSSNNSNDDSSDEDESDEDDSAEEDSDDSDALLTPAEQARILMERMAEDDPVTSVPLRTHNEKPDEIKPKPTLDVTPTMRITELGNVQSIIDNFILVAANTSGEYMVLEADSVLCLQDRTVLGVVHETIGLVQSPVYMIGYKTPEEAKETGVTKGTKVFYVDAHSKFLFTQNIKKNKGTDASNVFDEPVPDEEMAFSDDELERAAKKKRKDKKKQAWQEAQNGMTRSNRRHHRRPTGIAANSYHQTAYPTKMKYDDDDADSDPGMYRPLARPDNLHEMMARGAPEERLPRSITNGRGRGRGDRQWVDRGRSSRGRGGRGRGNDAGAYSQRYDNARRGRGGYRGQDQRNPLPARPEQSASQQTSAFPWIPPMVNGVPVPPPTGMSFPFNQPGLPAFSFNQRGTPAYPFNQRDMSTFSMPPPVPGSVAHNNFQNGNSVPTSSFFEQQFKFNQFAQQFAHAPPPPQWSQAPAPPPPAPHAWSGMQTQQLAQQQPQQQPQQQKPQQFGPSNAQLEELLRMMNANKPKQ